MAEGWKNRIIVSIVKKEERKKVEDYRKVTLMSALYKVYLMVLLERIRKDDEKRNKMPQNQTKFKKRMGTIDNIYVTNYSINKQEKEKKMVALFVDMKMAFDSVDREVLYRVIKKREIRKRLVEKVKKILRDEK